MLHHLQEIIQKCKSQDRTGQKELFELYKDILFPVCLRYVKNAEDWRYSSARFYVLGEESELRISRYD